MSNPNKFSQDLIPFKIKKQYFKEYCTSTPLSWCMGPQENKPIQLLQINAGEGGTYRLPLEKDGDYEHPITGYNQLAGAESDITIYEDRVDYDIVRFASKIRGLKLVKKLTPLEIYGRMKDGLVRRQKKNLVKSLLDSATILSYPDLIKTTGSLINNGPDASRYVVGKGTGTFETNEGLNVKHIRALRNKAINTDGEYSLTPAEVKTRNNFPEETFIYLIDPRSYNSLALDPEWQKHIYRGVVADVNQPEGLSGARFRGKIEGVMIYETPELQKYSWNITNSAVKTAWNLFLGAQAFAVVWAERPYFEFEWTDYNFNCGMAACEIRGQKALKYPSKTGSGKKVERGIIHSFVSISPQASSTFGLTSNTEFITSTDATVDALTKELDIRVKENNKNSREIIQIKREVETIKNKTTSSTSSLDLIKQISDKASKKASEIKIKKGELEAIDEKIRSKEALLVGLPDHSKVVAIDEIKKLKKELKDQQNLLSGVKQELKDQQNLLSGVKQELKDQQENEQISESRY